MMQMQSISPGTSRSAVHAPVFIANKTKSTSSGGITRVAVFQLSAGVMSVFMLLANVQVHGKTLAGVVMDPVSLKGAAASAAPAHAPWQGSVSQTLSTVTVTGAIAQDERPWQSTTTRADLNRFQVQGWHEFAQRVQTGVNFNQRDGSINIRGLDKNRVLMTIDGVDQSWLSDIRYGYGNSVRGGMSNLDFNSIASIDIERGAGTSRLGSGAMGGAVVVRTLEPEDVLAGSQDPKRQWAALTKTGFQTVNGSAYINGAVAGRVNDAMTWLLQAGTHFGHAMKNHGTEGGVGETRSLENPGDFQARNYLFKLRQQLEGGHRLGVSGSYFRRDGRQSDLGASTTTYVPGRSFSQDMSERQGVVLDYDWQKPQNTPGLDAVAVKLYWQKTALLTDFQSERLKVWEPKLKSFKLPYGAYTRTSTMEEQTYGTNVRVRATIDGAVSQRWETGGQWAANSLTQFAAAKDNCVRSASIGCLFHKANQADMPATQGQRWGAWLQNTLSFAEGKLALTPAIRYDHYQLQPDSDAAFQANPVHTGLPEVSAGAWSPKLLATWHLSPSWSLYGQFSKGFTAPTATQLYSRYGTPATYLYKGNPDLKPETSRGWEFGVQYADKRLRGSVTYFDTHYSNFIQKVTLAGFDRTRRPYPMQIVSFDNLERARIYGVEANAQWQVNRSWKVSGSFAWSVGKDLDANTYLNSVPPLTTLLGVNYTQDDWGIGAQWRLAAARNRVQYPHAIGKDIAADFKAPGYGILDLTAYWTPAAIKGLTIEAGVFNVLNKTYWNALEVPAGKGGHGASRPLELYTQPGVNMAVSMTYHY